MNDQTNLPVTELMVHSSTRRTKSTEVERSLNASCFGYIAVLVSVFFRTFT